IHGFVGGPMSSLGATDVDGDGYIEAPEAEAAAGGGLLSLVTSSRAVPGEESDPNKYPAAASDGTLLFSQTYTFDLTNSTQALAFAELQQLAGRAIEVHGLTVPDGPGAGTPFEVNGLGGYKDILPVAAGLIQVAGTE